MAGALRRLPPLGDGPLSQSAKGDTGGVAGTPWHASQGHRIALDARGLSLTGHWIWTAAGAIAYLRDWRGSVAGGWLDAPVTLTGAADAGQGTSRSPLMAGTVDLRRSTLRRRGAAGKAGQSADHWRWTGWISPDSPLLPDRLQRRVHQYSGLDGSFSGRINDQAPIVGRAVH